MELEEIVNKILSSRSNVKREEILQMIKNKKREARNFLTDETAARLVASELEVEITKKPLRFKIQIKDLVSGLNDVSLTGQVVSVYPAKTFKRRDWTEGKLASMIISDSSGSLRAVLWDNKVDLIENGKIQQKQTVRIEHGYTRQGQNGRLEVHIGEKGRIKILTNTTKKLAEITETEGPITVEGTISTMPDFKEVNTSRNERVTVASFQLSDKTGKLRVSAWRNIAETVKGLKAGTKIKIKNIYAKRGYENRIELSSTHCTIIEILEK